MKGGATHRRRSAVEQTAVLGAAEAKAGVDVAAKRQDVGKLQEQEAMAVEGHGPSHLPGERL